MGRKYTIQSLKNEFKNENEKFWKFYNQYKVSNKENKVRLAEWMSDNIDINEIDKNNKYYSFIEKFLNGKVVTNSFGKKLYWQF